MKKLLLFTFFLNLPFALLSQTIPNGDFENWNSASFEDPRYYPNTSNYQNLLMGLPANALKVSDPQAGSYAIQLNTVTNGVDTSFGYFINGDPNSLAGGIPYAQHPVAITGYYKCNILAGDTGIIIIGFKQAGIMVSLDAGQFYGVHNTYTPFTVTLNIPPMANPDSVIVGAASSNAFVWQGIPGSMLQLDNLSFTGVASQPTDLNGSFELWDGHTSYSPASWNVGGDSTYRSSIAHSGSFSLRLGTIYYGGPSASFGVATTGTFTQNGPPVGGRPYTLTSDTLKGWYQFTPTGVDSATVWINCSLNGSSVGGAYVGLPPTTGWTQFSIPFSSGIAPDTLMLTFASIYASSDSTNYGNVLLVDQIELSSSPLSVPSSWSQLGLVKVYPDPAVNETWIDYNNVSGSEVSINIFDATGKMVFSEINPEQGAQRYHINLNEFPRGNYLLVLEQNGNRVTRKLVVQ